MSTVAILSGIGLIARILISSMSAFLETEIQQHLRHYPPSALLETYRAVNADGTAGTGSNYPDPDCEAAGGILKAPFCRFSFADQVSVIPEESRVQLFSEATHDFSDKLSAFVETSYSSNKISRTLGPYLFKHGTLNAGRMFYSG